MHSPVFASHLAPLTPPAKQSHFVHTG